MKKSSRMGPRAVPRFLKWAGGKGQLLGPIMSAIPEFAGAYFEPFVGGGAVFFGLALSGRARQAVLNDANPNLVTAYTVVRDHPRELVEALAVLKAAHGKVNYYEARRRFNEEPLTDVGRAAHLIYLNKTCYNGLYRVNSRGGFNVPFGTYANPKIFDVDQIMACSAALRDVRMMCGDFEAAVSGAKAGDFVYFDPPYVPLTKTANFTSYAKDDFGFDDQIRLAETARRLHTAGVKFLLSNHSTPELEELYARQGFTIERVPARRMITRDGEGRSATVDEVLIRNY